MVIEECFGNSLFRGFHELGDRFRKQASPVNHYLRRDRLSQSYGKSATTVKKIIDACTLLEEKLELRSRSMRTITFYSDVERISSYKHVVDFALSISEMIQDWLTLERSSFDNDLSHWNKQVVLLYLQMGIGLVAITIGTCGLGLYFAWEFSARLVRLAIMTRDYTKHKLIGIQKRDELGVLENTLLKVFSELESEQCERVQLSILIGDTLVRHARAVSKVLEDIEGSDLGGEALANLSYCRNSARLAQEKIEEFCDDLQAASDGRLLNKPIRPELTTAHMLVGTSLLQVEKSAVRKNIRLINSCSHAGLCVDEVVIGRVLCNLINNAIKFAPQGSTVEVTDGVGPNVNKISVLDQGIGIDPEKAQALFEPFHREQKAQKIEGFGLGLSICRRFVEMHGGEIGASSRPMGGSVFWFTIPGHSPGSSVEAINIIAPPKTDFAAWRYSKIFRKIFPVLAVSVISQLAVVSWMFSSCELVNSLVNSVSMQHSIIWDATTLWVSFFRGSYNTLLYFSLQQQSYEEGAKNGLRVLRGVLADCNKHQSQWKVGVYPLHDELGYLDKGALELAETLEQPDIFDNSALVEKLSAYIQLAEKSSYELQDAAFVNFETMKRDIQLEEKRLQQTSIEAMMVLFAQAFLSLMLTWYFSRTLNQRLKFALTAADSLPGRLEIRRLLKLTDELDEVINALADASMQLRISDQRRQQAISGLAHDLRLPLQTLKFTAESLREAFDSHGLPEGTVAISSVARSLNRDIDLVESILMIYRLADTTDSNKLEYISVVSVIFESLRNAAELADEKDIFIEFEHESDFEIETSKADFELFIRKLVNLAILVSPEHSEVTVHLCKPDSGIFLKIEHGGQKLWQSPEPPDSFDRIAESQDICTALELLACAKFSSRQGLLLQFPDADVNQILCLYFSPKDVHRALNPDRIQK